MNAPTYTKTGTKATAAAKLNPTIFDVPVEHHELLKAVYLAYWANSRQNLAKTKTRAMVRGGGKKPWKQKGTGRARFGSIRVPIWRGGGIALGPTGNENYSMKVNVKAKRLALRQALTLKAKDNAVMIVEEINFDGKTKSAADLLTKLQVANKPVLLVVDQKSDKIVRSVNNLGNVQLTSAAYLNTASVLDASAVVMTADALKALEAATEKAVKAAKGEKA